MWSLLKLVMFLAVLGAGAYAVFFVPLGGATVAEHSREIWRSTVVQGKVKLVREGVKDELAQKLERALANQSGESAAPEITETDRRDLDELLRRSR